MSSASEPSPLLGQIVHFRFENAVARDFCAKCGTQLLTRRPGLRAIVLKAGTLDDPSRFGISQMAINTEDRQAFNCIREGLPAFEELPPR